MTRDEFAATLDRLGYGQGQAAEAIGCTRSAVTRILGGTMPVSEPVARSLQRHEKLVLIADALASRRRVDPAWLEAPIPEARRGRPPKAA